MAWTAPKTWTVGEMCTAALLNTHVRDNLNYLKTEADRVDDHSEGDVTGSRNLGTSYQNSTKIRICSVCGYNNAGTRMAMQAAVKVTDPGATPGVSDLADYSDYNTAPATDAYLQMFFMVPPSWYYRVNQVGTTKHVWYEWDLF